MWRHIALRFGYFLTITSSAYWPRSLRRIKTYFFVTEEIVAPKPLAPTHAAASSLLTTLRLTLKTLFCAPNRPSPSLSDLIFALALAYYRNMNEKQSPPHLRRFP